MAQYWRNRVLLFKLETVYGTDPTPTGLANAVLGIDITLMPMEGNDVSRELDLPYMAAQGTLPSELHSKLTFKVELAASGAAGTAPAWGPLLRACGCAQTIVPTTSVTFNPVTDGHESGTFYFNMDGTLSKISGARGKCKVTVNAQGIAYLEFEFNGLFSQPTAVAKPTADFSAFKKPEIVSKSNTPVFTIDGAALVMRSFAMDMGQKVENRFLVNSESVVITGRAETIQTTVEAVPLAMLNPYALAANSAEVPIVLQHGTVVGKRITLNVPKAQMQRPEGAQNAQSIIETPLRLIPQAASGNDQFTLVLT
jgi:hypothetical protein